MGQGKCRFHGGATPIKHGRHSLIKRPRLEELQAQHLAEPDPLGLLKELALARALLDDYLVRAKDRPATRNPVAMQLVGDVSRIVERIERIRAANAVSLPTLLRVMNEMGRVVDALVTDPGVKQKIQEAWMTIRVG